MQIKTFPAAVLALHVGTQNERIIEEAVRVIVFETGISDRMWVKWYEYEDTTTVAELRAAYRAYQETWDKLPPVK